MRSTVPRVPALLLLGLNVTGIPACAQSSGPSGTIRSLDGELIVELRIDAYEHELLPIAPAGSPNGAVSIGPEGSIAVRQLQSLEVVVFDRNGREVRRIGRRGDGPGEFQRITRIGWLGDAIGVVDGRASRVTIFPNEGASPPETRRYPSRVAPQSTPAGSTPAFPFVHISGLVGRDALVASLMLGSLANVPGFTGFTTIATLDWDGDIQDVLTRVPIGEVQADLPGGGVAVLPFPEETHAQYSFEGRSVTSAHVEAQVEDSALVRITSVDLRGDTTLSRVVSVPTFPIAASIREEARSSFLSRTGVQAHIPDVYPPLTGLLVGPAGEIWLELANPEEDQRIYSVHGADGSLSGRIAVPDTITVAAVDGPTVWALEKDAVDIEHLIRYRLTWLK